MRRKTILIKRSTSIFSAALPVLLWTSMVIAASNSVQDQTSSTRPKPIVLDKKLSMSSGLVEEFGFSISNFQIDHQGEKNILNLIIHYRYRPNLTRDEYPDFTLIAKDIENLLGNYPDKTDYWELVNKRLTQMILQKYPVLAEITSQIEVSPTPSVRYPRMSIVTRRQPATRGRARK
jgi:hypothetical protein